MKAFKRLPTLLLLLTFPALCSAQSQSTNQVQGGEWKEFVSTEGRFSVLLPGTPSRLTQPVDNVSGKVAIFTVLETADGVYVVMFSDISANSTGPEIKMRALDAGRDRMLAKDPGLRLVSENNISLAEHPGREWLVADKQEVTRGRSYVVDNRLYVNLFVMSNSSALNTGSDLRSAESLSALFETKSLRFLDSFKLLQPAAETPGEVDNMLRDLKERKVNVLVMGSATSDTPAKNQITGEVINGKAVRLVQPEYPAIAFAAHASGKVSVLVIIDQEGNVAAAQVKEGNPLLWSASLKAARASKFSPTRWKGEPVMVAGVILYNFVAP